MLASSGDGEFGRRFGKTAKLVGLENIFGAQDLAVSRVIHVDATMTYHTGRHEHSRLVRLFGSDRSQHSFPTQRSLAQILVEQLHSPILSCLEMRATQIHFLGVAQIAPDGYPLETLADLFDHPNPPIWLLRAVKNFANLADARPNEPLPPEVATSLYFCAIAAGFTRHNARITSLSDSELREGLEWTASQRWVDRTLRRLAITALKRFHL
jgi:hypothetical protein